MCNGGAQGPTQGPIVAEAAVVAAIQRLLRRRGAWCVNVHGAGVGRNGIPDILACYRGRFISIEVKQARGRVRPQQAYELERIRRAGGCAIVARDVEHVAILLDAIDHDASEGT